MPSVHRDTSAWILHLVADATEPVPIVKETKFIADTLFCEWAYVVDLDTETLEVYSGIQEGAAQSRFGSAEGVSEGNGPSCMASFSFANLPQEEGFVLTASKKQGEHDEEKEERDDEVTD
ncbi:hypothetical protein LTR27_008555 [Elasticomyces elasticus]|nr:hypothetical protein LTR27_008555 [Elasticomyces elasticus]